MASPLVSRMMCACLCHRTHPLTLGHPLPSLPPHWPPPCSRSRRIFLLTQGLCTAWSIFLQFSKVSAYKSPPGRNFLHHPNKRGRLPPASVLILIALVSVRLNQMVSINLSPSTCKLHKGQTSVSVLFPAVSPEQA